jgi:tetratricopeptide (TPR) repeat protein
MLLATLAFLSIRAIPFLQAVDPVPSAPVQDSAGVAQREADVYNYVSTRLRVLKRGAAVEDLKNELVNEIDFGTISPRSVNLLKRFVVLCDQAIANQASVKQQLAATDAQESRAETGALAATGTALMIEGTAPLVAALSRLQPLSEADSKRNELLAKTSASLSAEISAMELDLAVLRSQVQADGHLPAAEFVNPADCDQFLEAAAKTVEADRIAGVSAALERSPRLQPAALHLAIHFFRAKSFPRCVEYADQVIDQAPRILRRDALRAQAYLFKAVAADAEDDYQAALKHAEEGLKDDPANPSLLYMKAKGAVRRGDYDSGLPLFEKLTLLQPRNPVVFYNLACCLAVARKDAVAAMDKFKQALDLGFTGIEQARRDSDLAIVREKYPAEFQLWTTLRLGFEVDWHTLSPHSVIIWNESKFPLVDVHISLTVLAHDSAHGTNRSAKIAREVILPFLAPDAKQVFPGLMDTSPKQLVSLHIQAEGSQGRLDAIYPAKDLLEQRKPSPRAP